MSNITFVKIEDVAVENRYVVVDMTGNGIYTVVFDDHQLLQDGHPHKNLAIAAAAAKRFDVSFVCILQLTENDAALQKVCVAVTAQGMVHPPADGMRPIHLITKKGDSYERVKYASIPFNADVFIPIFEKLRGMENEQRTKPH